MATSTITADTHDIYVKKVGGSTQTQFTITCADIYQTIFVYSNSNRILDVWNPNNGQPMIFHYGATDKTTLTAISNKSFRVTAPQYTQLIMQSDLPFTAS